MLTKEQVSSLKKQIIQQINSTFPEDKKSFAVNRVEEMNSEELEEFLVKNGLVGNSSGEGQPPCVFCSIVSGRIHSHKIAETESCLAVLEINPISRGHVIIIPKEHSLSNESRKSLTSFATSISKKLKVVLKPKKVLESTSNVFGHETISLIPKFKDETIDSERHKATQEELSELQQLLMEKVETKKEIITKSSEVEKVEENYWLPRRIP